MSKIHLSSAKATEGAPRSLSGVGQMSNKIQSLKSKNNALRFSLVLVQLCFFLVLCSFIFLQPVRAGFLAPILEGTSSSSPPIEISLEMLSEVGLTPESPLFFLKILWENLCFVAKRVPRDKALLILDYARKRLSEAVKLYLEEADFSVIERLFKERANLLENAYQLAGGDAEVAQKIGEQLELGRTFLESLVQRSDSEEASPSAQMSISRAENLLEWQKNWAVKFETATPSAESSPAAVMVSRTGPPNAPGFFRRVFNFIFGTRVVLSPLAIPGGE